MIGNPRSLLRGQIKRAWCQVIREDYPNQSINSERSLQVRLSSRLLDAFKQKGLPRTLFVEPKVRVAEGCSHLHPDLLVCSSDEIIGVIELKYMPHKAPNYTKDFDTFVTMARASHNLIVTNRRYRGPDCGQCSFSLASDAVFVWAGAYRAPRVSIPDYKVPKGLSDRLMVLHAVCSHDSEPTLVLNDRRILKFP